MSTDSLCGQHFHELSKREPDKAASKAQLKHKKLYQGKEGFVTAIWD
jgi:hypothetical protein